MNLVYNPFERRFRKLSAKYGYNMLSEICNVQSIIGFDNILNGTYKMHLTHHNGYCIFHIHYKHTENEFDLISNNIRELPPEINNLIAEYLPSYITLELRIDYDNHYPFIPPIWSISTCHDYLASSLKNAEEYYKYIVSVHNNINNLNWSPAIDIEKDILTLMVRINHFDSLFLDNYIEN